MFFTQAQRTTIRTGSQCAGVMGFSIGAFVWQELAHKNSQNQRKNLPVKTFPIDKNQYQTFTKKAGVELSNYLILTLGGAAVSQASFITVFLFLNIHTSYPKATKATVALLAASIFITKQIIDKKDTKEPTTTIEPSP